MTALATLLGASVLLGTQPAGAVPLSSRPRGPGAHYFGYFASANQEGTASPDGCGSIGDYTACVADHANVTFIGSSGSAMPDTTWTAQKLAEAQQLGMGAIVDVTRVFWDPGQVPAADYLARWANFKTAINPYLNTIVSFYLMDEPNTGSAQVMDRLRVEADKLAADFPGIHRQISFLARSLEFGGWTIPSNIDWVGYDCYTPPPGTFLNCAPPNGEGPFQSVPYYIGRLKAVIARSQPAPPALPYKPGLVLIPVAFLKPGETDKQDALLARAEREIAMAENDPDFVMVMPFIFQSLTDGFGQPWIGTRDLPAVRAYYQSLGVRITKASGQRRFAHPTSITASATASGSSGYGAFDFDISTSWNAGRLPPASITGSFADPLLVTQLQLWAAQSPTGPVLHQVRGTSLDGTSLVFGDISGVMSDFQLWSWRGAVGTSSIVVTTPSSPSWVSWRDIDVFTAGSTRVYGYPVAATGGLDAMQFIADANVNTAWNAGGFGTSASPQSIDLDLGQAQTLARIRLRVMQSPNGQTTHIVSGGPSLQAMTTLTTLTSWTSDNQVLDLVGPFINVRFLRIMTTSSPSWVAWREVDIFRYCPLKVRSPGDLSADCRGDIALTGGSSNGVPWTSVPVARSNGDGTFVVTNANLADFPLFATQSGALPVAGDFDNDGRGDIALTGGSSWNSIPVAFSHGDGTFHVTNLPVADFATYAAQSGAKPVAGDFDGDGRGDIALTGGSSNGAPWGSIPVAFSNGDGSFHVTNTSVASFGTYATQSGAKPVAGDFDGDGRGDIALTGGSSNGVPWNTVPVAFSNGNGSFRVTNVNVTSFGTYATQGAATPVSGDFDGDGRGDIALTGGSSNGAPWVTIPIAFSNGADGTFRVTNVGVDSFGTYATQGASPVAGDFNADGWGDIALTGGSSNGVPWNTLPVAFSNGDGSFSVTNAAISNFQTYATQLGAKPVGGY